MIYLKNPYFLFVVVILLGLFSRFYGDVHHYYVCKNYDPWPVDSNMLDPSTVTTNDFQHWLLARQHSESICNSKGAVTELNDSGGMGMFLFMWIPDLFAKSFEEGKVFRPLHPVFDWSDLDENYCTNHIRSVDCYFHSISNCTINTEFSTIDYQTTKVGKLLDHLEQFDTCTLAMKLHKSLIWVVGQLIHYTIQMRKDIRGIVNKRVDDILYDKEQHFTVGIHVRTGQLDYGRKVLSLESYMDALEKKLTLIDDIVQNRQIMIYFACNDIKNTIKTQEYLQEKFGEKYIYRFFYSMVVDVDMSKEIEYQFYANYTGISRRQLMIEYLTDVHVLTQTDLFIGSESSNYGVISALKHALYAPRFDSNICYIDREEKLICEPNNSESIPHLLAHYKGMTGGTPV